MQEANGSTDRVDTGTAISPGSAERLNRAESIITSHVLMSLGSGLIPITGFDLLAGLTIQLTLLKRLSTLYGVPYSKNLGKSIVLSFLSTIGGLEAGQTVALSFIKVIPIVGTAVGVVSLSAVLGAFTFALGKVFTQHLQSGGTFLDFDPKVYKNYFREMFSRGKSVVKNLKKTEPKPAVAEAV
jgi:uncharacterized protein (DUF697 family)